MNIDQFQQLQHQLMAQNAKLDQFWAILLQMQQDVIIIKAGTQTFTTSSSSNRRLVCPLECGADFKKVCRHDCAIIALAGYLTMQQVNYLLDHLYRSCKISRRQAVASATHDCVLVMANEAHRRLWFQIFPSGCEDTDENVSSPNRCCTEFVLYRSFLVVC